MLKWLFVIVVAFIVLRWMRQRNTPYQHLVSPEHLREISGGLGRVFPSAVEHIGRPPAANPFAAGNAFQSSAHVAIFYTIAKASDGGFEHHVSMSHDRRTLSKEVAAFLAAAIARMLGLPGLKGVLAQSKTGTFHFIVPFSAADHTALVARGIQRLDENVARQWFELALEDREHLLKNLGTIEVQERSS